MLSYLNPLPSLPPYRGPHKVGTIEYEIPVSEIQSTSAVPDERIKTIKFRIYYPTIPEATSKQSVYWLPTPQKQWNEAYSSFMGASPRFSSMMSNLPSLWNYAKLPVIKDAPLQQSPTSGHPVCIFSHGLGGNFNTYSSIVGNLASCGVISIAPEHRDGSAPVSFIKNQSGDIETSIPYQKLSHSPNVQVFNARNSQLRIRMWELELIYTVVKAMNEGKQFTNYAEENSGDKFCLQHRLNLQPGQVTWAGHSFGAATTTQFVKSIFYHAHLPRSSFTAPSVDDGEEKWNTTPLYLCKEDSDLVRQITPSSPIALLDIWTMPLRAETTKWLWERPMPCHHRETQLNGDSKPNMVAIMSAEFYKWTELLNRTRALLSESPIDANEAFDQKTKSTEREAPSLDNDKTRSTNPIPELSKQSQESRGAPSPLSSAESSRDPSPARSELQSAEISAKSSQTSLSPSLHKSSNPQSSTEPHLYLVPHSAHLSQSDFGVLFPNLTKYVMKAIEPEKTLELNLRAILATVRGAGLPVDGLIEGEDHILDINKMEKKEERWVRVPLVDA